jgi:hypothetical protein
MCEHIQTNIECNRHMFPPALCQNTHEPLHTYHQRDCIASDVFCASSLCTVLITILHTNIHASIHPCMHACSASLPCAPSLCRVFNTFYTPTYLTHLHTQIPAHTHTHTHTCSATVLCSPSLRTVPIAYYQACRSSEYMHAYAMHAHNCTHAPRLACSNAVACIRVV